MDEAANLSSCTSRNPDTRNGKPSHNGKLVYDNDRRPRCNDENSSVQILRHSESFRSIFDRG